VIAARTCPSCSAPNPLDLSGKCKSCKKRLPRYCFACSAPISSEKDQSCAACGHGRWVFGDEVQLLCTNEGGKPRARPHAYMRTKMSAGKVVHEWRCLQCFAQERETDALSHFPDLPLVEV
jgi:hypothetical protein